MSFNRKKFNPIRTITTKGKFLVNTIRLLLTIRRYFGGKDWEHAMDGHHEDPRKMRFREQLYFTYKYYYRAVTKSNLNSGLEKHFHQHSGNLKLPENFIAENEITLTTGGDLMPYLCINKNTTQHLWDEAGDFFFNADIVMANLETPMDLSQKVGLVPEVMLNHMYFNGNAEMFDIFNGLGKYKGYDILSLANNHSLDMGEDGLLATLRFLDEKNIAHCGTAETPEKRDDFPILERKGIKIAFISFTFSLNAEILPDDKKWMANHLNLNEKDADISLIIHQCKLARERGADLIVAALHMGCAYQPYPSKEIVDNMHRICKQSGIDVVIGGHPHNTQPCEWVDVIDPFTGEEKQSFVIYSQGDFIAWDIYKWCHLPLILKFKIASGTAGGKRVVRVTGIEGRLFYMQAKVEKETITELRLRDLKSLRSQPQSWPQDAISQNELKEIFEFADTFLLPGNLEKIVDTGRV